MLQHCVDTANLYNFLAGTETKRHLISALALVSAVDSDARGVGEVGGLGVATGGIVYNLHKGKSHRQIRCLRFGENVSIWQTFSVVICCNSKLLFWS